MMTSSKIRGHQIHGHTTAVFCHDRSLILAAPYVLFEKECSHRALILDSSLGIIGAWRICTSYSRCIDIVIGVNRSPYRLMPVSTFLELTALSLMETYKYVHFYFTLVSPVFFSISRTIGSTYQRISSSTVSMWDRYNAAATAKVFSISYLLNLFGFVHCPPHTHAYSSYWWSRLQSHPFAPPTTTTTIFSSLIFLVIDYSPQLHGRC